ncbi:MULTISPECIES: protein IsiD [unclassified Microcoleus]|uniref:protein IsiD n=1 Tax=unclassified Microcoleus TaxID=2642155 RepID=UPI002FD76FA0
MKTLTKASRDIAVLTSQDVAELAVRLEVDDYTDPFEGLNDWHLLRALAFQRPELVEPYLHLLDMEAYDEA